MLRRIEAKYIEKGVLFDKIYTVYTNIVLYCMVGFCLGEERTEKCDKNKWRLNERKCSFRRARIYGRKMRIEQQQQQQLAATTITRREIPSEQQREIIGTSIWRLMNQHYEYIEICVRLLWHGWTLWQSIPTMNRKTIAAHSMWFASLVPLSIPGSFIRRRSWAICNIFFHVFDFWCLENEANRLRDITTTTNH